MGEGVFFELMGEVHGALGGGFYGGVVLAW